MSNVQSAPEKSVRAETDKSHYGNQSEQWREIGITAVAAAARYAGEARQAKSAGEVNKIVTLRDIDHLAA